MEAVQPDGCWQLRKPSPARAGAARPSGPTAEARVSRPRKAIVMSVTVIGPTQASSLDIATATPPRARVGTAGAAIVPAAARPRGGSREPSDARSDAACHAIGAYAIDASSFGPD